MSAPLFLAGFNARAKRSRASREGWRKSPRAFVIEHRGQRWTMPEIAEKVGITRSGAWTRYARGKRGDDLFAPPQRRMITPRNQPQIFLRHEGRRWSLPEIAAYLGAPRKLVWNRYSAGWSVAKLFQPVKRKALDLRALSQASGINPHTIKARLARGLSLEEALRRPLAHRRARLPAGIEAAIAAAKGTQREVAARYGVNQVTVCRVRARTKRSA